MATEDQLREYLRRATAELTDARRRLGEAEAARYEPLAITGMSCRFPGGGSVEGYWELLRSGRSAVTEVPADRWDVTPVLDPASRGGGLTYTAAGAFLPDVAGWDAGFFGIPPQEALRMDPQQRLLMELVWEGLEDAGIAPPRLAGSRTGVLVGVMDTVQWGLVQTAAQGTDVLADPYFAQGASGSVAAGRLAYQLDLRGPAVTLDTACSSALVGVHLAAAALWRGDCDLALAGGAYLTLRPEPYVQGCATSMLSPRGRCATFDRGADGYVMGEGGGIVVLERLSTALRAGRRVRAVLRGSAVNQDGRSNGLTAPSRGAQADVLRRALGVARVSPDDVDLVEAHGSGTALGDAIELAALHDVFGRRSPARPLHVGAVKTVIGHTQAAAGAAGLVKTVLALEHGEAPGNLHLTDPAEAVPADGTVRPLAARTPLPGDGGRPVVAGVSSFGWSGTNAHVVLEQAPVPDPGPEPPAGTRVLPVSAAGPAALRGQLVRLADHLEARPDLRLDDVAHTLVTGRAELDHRRAVTCRDLTEAVRELRDALAQEPARALARPRVAFLLPGVGDGYPGMLAGLRAAEPVVAEAVDRCAAVLRDRCGLDLEPVLAPAAAGDGPDLADLLGRRAGTALPLGAPELEHAHLFTAGYALAALLGHWGVRPDVLAGYSLGEYVAACLAGVLALEDALPLVVARARLVAEAPAGGMLAVAADEGTVRAALAVVGTAVEVAAVNGPAMTVLSGAAGDVAALAPALAVQGLVCRPVRTEQPFHSALLTPVRDRLEALVAAVPRSAPQVPVVSNRTGAVLSAEEITSAAHWAEHLTAPVRFADVATTLLASADVLVELGPGGTLGGLVRQNTGATPPLAVLGTLPPRWSADPGEDPRRALLETARRLWEAGVPVDWAAARRAEGRVVGLPTYAFDRRRYWPETTAGATAAVPAVAVPAAVPAPACYAPSWQPDPRRPAPGGALPDGQLVVWSDAGAPEAVGPALAALAAAAGTRVLEVVPVDGTPRPQRDGDRLVLDPADPAHLQELAAALDRDVPVTLVHLGALAVTPRPGRPAAAEELRAGLRSGFDGLLLAVQGLTGRAASGGLRLLTVSRGALEVLGGDAVAPVHAAAHGLGRVVRHELRGCSWSGVDLDPSGDPVPDRGVADAGVLLAELAAPATGQPGVTAWRRGRRWLPGLAGVPLQEVPAASPWRADGTYLVTGGTRGLGLALARRMVAAGVRRLVLVSRSAAEDAPGPAAGADPDPRVAASRAAVAELRAGGADVLLLAADAGDPGQLRAALQAARRHFGRLDGVVHAAGRPASGLVARTSPQTAAEVLAPKVHALAPLAELLAPGPDGSGPPELLVLYSSAVTAFGGIGEGDYCAANAVLDAAGPALAALAPATRVLSVAWGPWQHDDWQAGGPAGALGSQVRAYRERYGFPEEEGCALLERMLATGHTGLLALRQPLADAERAWSQILDLDALVGAEGAPRAERYPRPALRTAYAPPRGELEELVAGVWEAHLGIDRVGVHDPFFDLGGNSLVGMAMVHAVEAALGTPIAPAVLFEHPTVAAFAAALRPDAAERAARDLEASTDRGQRRRRARAGARRDG